jgi:hypothetical protein
LHHDDACWITGTYDRVWCKQLLHDPRGKRADRDFQQRHGANDDAVPDDINLAGWSRGE